jgi:hypothetical protein
VRGWVCDYVKGLGSEQRGEQEIPWRKQELGLGIGVEEMMMVLRCV